MQKINLKQTHFNKTADALVLAAFNALASTALFASSSVPAYAQFAGATVVMTAIQGMFVALGLSIIIIGWWVCGYKVIKKGATWDDIAHILIGSFIMGASVGIGGWIWGLSKV